MAVQEDSPRRILTTAREDGIISDICNNFSKDTDAIVTCGKWQYVVSRAALCKISKTLCRMSRAIDPDQEWEINMSNAPRSLVEKLLIFIQSGDDKIFKSMSPSFLFGVLSVAHSMEMTEVEKIIFSLLIRKPESYGMIAYLWDLADKYGNVSAIGEVVRYIQEHIADMTRRGFFNAISYDQLCHLMRHFSKKKRHDDLCLAIVQWLKLDPLRDMHSDRLAQRLNWLKISQDSICDLISTEPIFRRMLKYSLNESLWSPPKSVKLVLLKYEQIRLRSLCKGDKDPGSTPTFGHEDPPKGTVCYYALAWERDTAVQQFLVPKKQNTVLKSLVGDPAFLLLGATRSNSLALQVYFVKRRQWTLTVDINLQFRFDFGCCYRYPNMYILGGDRGNGSMFEKCYAYDVLNKHLQDFAPFRYPRCKAGVVVSGMKLFVLGGLNEERQAVSVAMTKNLSDPMSGWKLIKPMKEKHCLPGVVVDMCGNIFVIGGYTTSCERYSKFCWLELESLPEAYSNFGMLAVLCDQFIYAFRDSSPNEVCVFNLANNTLNIERTSGKSPDKIVSISYYGKEIWVINPKGRFYVYSMTARIWKKTPLKSKEMSQFFYLAITERSHVEYLDIMNETESEDPYDKD